MARRLTTHKINADALTLYVERWQALNKIYNETKIILSKTSQ